MTLIVRLLVLVGIALLARPWWPTSWTGWMPAELAEVSSGMVQAIGGAAVLGAVLLDRLVRWRGRGGEHDDGEIRAALSARGFRFIDLGRGWQADGAWRGEPVVVRRVSDTHATRFGRPWSLLVTLPGVPHEPWPFLPDQGGLVERGPDGFTVVIADLGFPGRAGGLAPRIDALLAARRGDQG